MPRGCPDVEPEPNEPTVRRGAACLEGPAWGTRAFLSRRAKTRQSSARSDAADGLELDYLFGAASVLQPYVEKARRCQKAQGQAFRL
jgi:hypothetical protein